MAIGVSTAIGVSIAIVSAVVDAITILRRRWRCGRRWVQALSSLGSQMALPLRPLALLKPLCNTFLIHPAVRRCYYIWCPHRFVDVASLGCGQSQFSIHISLFISSSTRPTVHLSVSSVLTTVRADAIPYLTSSSSVAMTCCANFFFRVHYGCSNITS